MKVVKVNPQGYCYGVVRAIDIAKKAAKSQPKPVYILGDIVHNKLVSESLSKLDLITIESKETSRVELLNQIDHGTVIFTAHGVSPEVRAVAKQKNLNMIDATCPEVMSTQDEIKKYLEMNYQIIFVGKKHHPEAEACINIDYNNTTFISSEADVKNISLDYDKYFITYQSTLNTEDTKVISSELEKLLAAKIFINKHSVCDATTARQNAIKTLKDVDFLIVVGDKNSNNSNKLVEIAINHANITAKRIMSINELDLNSFKDINTVAITSGASTPTKLTKHIIQFFEQFEYNNKDTWHYTEFSVDDL